MTYPTQAEIRERLRFGAGYAQLAGRYGLTMAEIAEIDLFGEVRKQTRDWAESLRGVLKSRGSNHVH